MTAETFSTTINFSSLCNLRFDVQRFFKNLAYLGIFSIASKSGMFTSTFQKVSRISFSCSSFFDLANLLGKGKGIELVDLVVVGGELTFTEAFCSSSSFLSPCCVFAELDKF